MPRALLPLISLLLVACGHVGKPQVIYIARHGQTEWNRKARFQGDPDLDPVGYVNRFNLWRLLKDRPLHAIYTSERLRTRRTAALLAKQHNLPISTRAALNEIDPGVFEGICFGQLVPEQARYRNRGCEVAARGSNPEAALKHARPVFKQAWSDRIDGKFPLGQSFRDVVHQTAAFVDELSRGLSPREVLVVGHGVVNRALLHHLMGWPLETVVGLRQENDEVYRVEAAWTGSPRLFLYSPGRGWKQCRTPPTPGARRLDCHPTHAAPRAAPPPPRAAPPPPASQPAEPPVMSPTEVEQED